MKTVHVRIDPVGPASKALGRIDAVRVDATTEEDIARQAATDETEAIQNVARFVRRVRKRLGLS